MLINGGEIEIWEIYTKHQLKTTEIVLQTFSGWFWREYSVVVIFIIAFISMLGL